MMHWNPLGPIVALQKKTANWFADQFLSLRENCPYSEFFRSVFFRISTEYKDLLRKYLFSVQMRENMDQKTPNTGNFI